MESFDSAVENRSTTVGIKKLDVAEIDCLPQ
jgi:hypothetical protein